MVLRFYGYGLIVFYIAVTQIHITPNSAWVILTTDEMEDEWLEEGLLTGIIKLLMTAIDEKEMEVFELKGGIGEVNLV